MTRNIMGTLITVGNGKNPPSWIEEITQAKNREISAPTFAPMDYIFWDNLRF